MVQPPQDRRRIDSLLEIVKALRGPQGCPWDKEQTHRTLTPFAIEEAHELAEAIENDDQKDMISELGDLLLQVVLHAEIGRQAGKFEFGDVVQAIADKMVYRHPHVFSDIEVADSNEVLDNWSRLKEEEKKMSPNQFDSKKSMRFDVSLALPALARAQKIGDKTKRLRFDWADPVEVMAKVDEELRELKDEMTERDPVKLEHELGDLLFSTAQLARHLKLEAEQCLRSANARFEHRFFTMKALIEASGRSYDDLSLEQLEEAWQATKISLNTEE